MWVSGVFLGMGLGVGLDYYLVCGDGCGYYYWFGGRLLVCVFVGFGCFFGWVGIRFCDFDGL